MSAINQLSTLPDTALLEQCLQRKDRDAFAVLVDRYKNLICSVAYNILGDLGQSEDVAQETFVTAWKKLSSLREPEKLKPWLCGIARHRALAVIRKRRPEGEMTGERVTNDSPDVLAVASEEEALIWEALEKLPDNYREPLILFYREEQSITRVAEGLELSEDAVRQRLSRGRALLRDRMLSLVEGTLAATRPGPAFTLAVMGALPGILVTSAGAATVGAAGKASGIGAGAGGAAIFSGAFFGTLGGMLGGLLGWYAGDRTARYQEQREQLRKSLIPLFIGVAIFQLPWITMALGWWSAKDLGPAGYLLFWFAWMISFFAFIGILSWRLGKRSREIHRRLSEQGVAPLPPSSARRFLQGWEGRRWTSRASFLGLPVVSIAFADPDRDFSGYSLSEKEGQKTARGWIAIGDRAIGLLAIGNIATGGVAVGSVSFGALACGGIAGGGIAIGGLTLSLLSIGGLALGLAAVGGVAMGLWAYGGAAVAWISAKGGFAAARELALGGEAFAKHGNDETAKAYFVNHPFYEFGDSYLQWLQNPSFLPVFWFLLAGGIGGVLLLAYRRKKDGGGEADFESEED
jgi:RNA polymerase sigma factor (sigma-70 family)